MAIEEVGSLLRNTGTRIETKSREQEFSIEIPDKEADAIHSSKASERYLCVAAANNL